MAGQGALDGGDALLFRGSWRAVMRCIGATRAGAEDVMLGEEPNFFFATRPCGHHAEPDRAMGFCIFNQTAIAAAHSSRAYELERVAVVDFDVDHGMGRRPRSRRRGCSIHLATSRRCILAQAWTARRAAAT